MSAFNRDDLDRIIRILEIEAADLLDDMKGSTMDAPETRREKEAERAGLLSTVEKARAAMGGAPSALIPEAVVPSTPGPWTVTLADNDVACLHDASGRHFANLRNVRGDGLETLEADANLAAAAPAMFAALRAVLHQALQGSVLPRDACVRQARNAYLSANLMVRL